MERIKIERVDERTSQRGGRYLELRLADGRTVYCWAESLFPLAKPGAELEAEIADGRWPKLKAARVPSNGAGPADEPLELRGRAALRAVALRAAVELAKAKDKPSAESVLRLAESFFAWLTE